MRKFVKGTVFAALVATSQLASAALILQDQGNGSIQVDAFEPVGQSFTAEDAFVSFGFYFRGINLHFPVGDLTVSLLSGDGTGGPVLASTTFSLAGSYDGYFDVDFSSVALTVGSSYTASLSAVGSNPYWGVALNTGQIGDLYESGRLYTERSLDSLGNIERMDARFRVTPVSVPEPASLALLGIGLAGVALARRKRTR